MSTSAVEQPGLVARFRHIFTALPVAAILLLAIVFGTSSYMHSQMLALGQSMWSNYGMVRADMRAPTCDPNFDVEARVEKQMQRAEEQAEDSLLAFQAPNPDNLRRSLTRQLARCQEQHQLYEYNQQMRESPWVRAYTSVEHSVGELNEVGLDARKYLLITIVLFCAVVSTLRRSHISLRAIQTRTEGRVSALLQLVGNGLLLASALSWRSVATKAGDTTPMAMHLIWIVGFAALVLINAVQCVRSQELSDERTSVGKALLTVPLYTYMALIAGTYFILSENYVAGNAVQLIKLVSHADLYINVGLYVWVGMLLKQTRLAKLVFDAIRPWQLAPELIVVVTVLLAAYPTAFTGASGIFLIAVGGIIYEEIRLSGARRPLAYAMAQTLCEQALAKLGDESALSQRVQRYLLTRHNEFPTLEQVCRQLHTTPRTLHRRLKAEGTSFRELTDTIKHRLALQYLQEGQSSLQEVAYLLGYSDLANFRRAFKRWVGMSPSEYLAQ